MFQDECYYPGPLDADRDRATTEPPMWTWPYFTTEVENPTLNPGDIVYMNGKPIGRAVSINSSEGTVSVAVEASNYGR